MTARAIGRHGRRAAVGVGRAAVPLLRWGVRRTTGGFVPDIAVPPHAQPLDLPGRGTTHVLDLSGPAPDAPVLLLMHGIATTGPLTWFSVLDELRDSYRVVTFDQRWHGRGIRSENFSLEDCADDAAAVLDALGIGRAVVVGYSMGGASAQVMWHRHPERVDGLVLCSTAARWQGHLGERVFFLMLRALNLGLLSTAATRVRAHGEMLPPHDPEAVAELREWCLAELRCTSPWALPVVLNALGGFDASGYIGGITVPTGMVITGNDRAIPTARQRDLAAVLPDPVVRETPGGHASLVFDLPHWRPAFLATVHDVVARVTEAQRSA